MARAERSGAGAFRQAPWGAARGGKAQRPFERVAEPTGGRDGAWQPSRARGQSSGGAVSAAALTGPRAAAQTGIPMRPLVREPLLPATDTPPGGCQPSAGEGSLAPLPGHTATAVTAQAPAAARRPHGLGKTARTGGRTVAARGGAACGLLGEQREAHGEEQDLQ